MNSSIELELPKREGGGRRTERTFLDFIVDGKSLWENFDTDFIWRDFGFQNNYDSEIQSDNFTTIEPLTFDATEYYTAINSAIDTIK